MDHVRDRFDHVLEVLWLGLIVGREVKLIQRVLASAAPAHAPYYEGGEEHTGEQHAAGDLERDDQGA